MVPFKLFAVLVRLLIASREGPEQLLSASSLSPTSLAQSQAIHTSKGQAAVVDLDEQEDDEGVQEAEEEEEDDDKSEQEEGEEALGPGP